MLTRGKNIDVMLKMVQKYMNGELDYHSFVLNFPNDMMKHYKEMMLEDPAFTGMMYVNFMDKGIAKKDSYSDAEFRAVMWRLYNDVTGKFDI